MITPEKSILDLLGVNPMSLYDSQQKVKEEIINLLEQKMN
jgi:hypothetical protein